MSLTCFFLRVPVHKVFKMCLWKALILLTIKQRSKITELKKLQNSAVSSKRIYRVWIDLLRSHKLSCIRVTCLWHDFNVKLFCLMCWIVWDLCSICRILVCRELFSKDGNSAMFCNGVRSLYIMAGLVLTPVLQFVPNMSTRHPRTWSPHHHQLSLTNVWLSNVSPWKVLVRDTFNTRLHVSGI